MRKCKCETGKKVGSILKNAAAEASSTSHSMSISPDSAAGQELQQRINQHIAGFNLGEDIDDVSQYVVMLIGNDRSKEEMTGELQSLFGNKFTQDFSDWVYEEARKLVSGESGQQMDVVDQQESGFGGYEATIPASVEQPRSSLSLRQRIEGGGARGGVRGGGVGKGPRGGSLRMGPRFGRGDNRNLQAAIEKDVMGGQNAENNNGGLKTQKERCRHWPNCSYPGCKFWHPIQPCFKFPNCPNPKGTCKYIHYGEDLPANGMMPPVPGQAPPQMPPGWPNGAPGQFPPPQQQQVTPAEPKEKKIFPCKYSEKCSNNECAYGHPTPANDNAKVSDNEWCEEKENCKNENCTKAHPSGSLVREPEKIPERVLETCKFLNKCTKMYCRYRHPVTTTMCRNGADCQRVDCFFTHPFKEQCKFGINCKNSYCLYQHPPERDEMFSKPMVWVKDNENQSNDTDMQQAENIQQQATT